MGSVVKQRHKCMPEGQHEKEERDRGVDKEPGVQPVVQLRLEVEHATLVAPGLDFFDARAVGLGYAEFHKAKRVFGESRVAQTKFAAALGREIRENLSI